MTKRILSVLAMLSIAAMMMLSSCTAAGVECGLIGKWENVKNNDGAKITTTYEITTDDKFIIIVKAEHNGKTNEQKQEYTIESVSDHKIKVKEVDSELEYSDLGCDTVKFGGTEFKKVY